MDVTDPSLFVFTKISIDSGHGVASLSSSSLTQAGSHIYSFLPQMLLLQLEQPLMLFLCFGEMEAARLQVRFIQILDDSQNLCTSRTSRP